MAATDFIHIDPARSSHSDGPPSQPGEVLSPSQAKTYLDCGAKHFYRYVARIPSPQSSHSSLGKAVHSAIKENLQQKILTHQDLDREAALAVFYDAWQTELQDTKLLPEEDPHTIALEGANIVAAFLDEVAPQIEPAAVELPVQGLIGGVPVRGRIDIIDVHGRIIDFKSAVRSPNREGPPFVHVFQLATYVTLCKEATGQVRLNTLVRLKRKTKSVVQDFTISEQDQRAVEIFYPMVQAAIQSGTVIPNRASFLCTRKYCPYWRECEREYGGTIPGEAGDE